MLMHEWIRYRNRQVKPGSGAEADAAAEEVASPADETPEASETLTLVSEEAEAETAAPPVVEPPAEAARAETESTSREREEVLAGLEEEVERAGEGVRERLRQLQARQRQLPIDVAEAAMHPEEARPRRVSETRQELVQRLLDPTLTLRESALLLDVCPTTVRRYTNRGLLKCFRTPGNQRRFRLADVLDFMERRDQGEV